MAAPGVPNALLAWPLSPANDPAVRRGRFAALAALCAFAVLTWLVVPHGIGSSWRECDTQAIARNFVVEGFDVMRPRIDWRGDTDGAVECEFPLYQLAIASVMRVFGEGEWPGRLLSLLATLFAGLALHRLLEQRTGASGALAGLLVFLSCGSVVMVATRVMPDAWCLALAVVSLPAFVRYLGTGSGLSLATSMLALAFAGLQKPLALQLGWVMFGWALLLAPRRLREVRLWLGWGAVVAVVLTWLLHAKSLHDETGLTFGVLSGGDTKFPALEHLLSPTIHAQLIRTTVLHGLSALGVMAAVWLVLRRRLDKADAVLLGSVAAALYLSLRYSYHHRMGPHYHCFAALAGAWCVARVWPLRAGALGWSVLLALVVAQGGWRIAHERHERTDFVSSPMMDIAASIRRLTAPDAPLVVRGRKLQRDPLWQRRNNFEDPILLYQAQRKGWVLPVDGFDAEALAELRDRGARYVFDCVVGDDESDAARWLAANADVVMDGPHGRLHRLHTGE